MIRRLAPILVALVAAASFAAGADSAPRTTTVHVAFVRAGKILPVVRTVPAEQDPAESALRQLLHGPSPAERAQGFRSAIASETILRWLRLTGEGYVASFTSRLLAPATPRTQVTRFAQILATLRQFGGASTIAVAVNGRLVDTLSLAPAPPTWRPRAVAGTALHAGEYPFSLRGVQLRLASLGYLDRADVTGELDYRTSQALLAFQGWQGIDRTATVDEQSQLELARATRPRPAATGVGHRIEIHRDRGVLLTVDGNEVIRAVHTSTGAYGRTPAGEFAVYRKERLSWSNLFHVWMPFAAYFTGGIATHEYPDVPSYPASHGCVRLPAGEAERVWNFVSLGTPVRVF